MRKADVNGITIAFDVRGSGPPLVLIMGYRLSSSAWPSSFIDGLSKRFTLILFDNRGTGLSDKPTFGYEISNMAKDVRGLLDHLEITRANILGYSMGGAIAQRIRPAISRSGFRSSALCNDVRRSPRSIRFTARCTGDARARRAEAGRNRPADLGDYIFARISREPPATSRRSDATRDRGADPFARRGFTISGLCGIRLLQGASEHSAKTLVLTGDLDRLVSPQNSKFITSLIPGASLIVIPGCGHRMMWEATDECIGFVTEFLIGVSERSRDNLALPLSQDSYGTLADFVSFLTPAVDLLRTGHGCWQEPGSIQ